MAVLYFSGIAVDSGSVNTDIDTKCDEVKPEKWHRIKKKTLAANSHGVKNVLYIL